MTTSRERILGRIRTGIRADLRTPEQKEALHQRLANPERGVIPARAELPTEESIDFFETRAKAQACTMVRVKSESEAVAAVSNFLRDNNLPAKVVMSSSEKVADLPWEEGPALERRQGAARADDEVSVTPVAVAVAETGTMVAVSGPQTPTTLNFVPDNHVVIVRKSDLVGSYEDAWERLRQSGPMPRTVNWLSGPSRSADIGQTMYMGAHGPRRQHIIFIEE